ncbi:MAG: M48 family metalloprotease [Gaiellales bacterium]|nr:M48 family metalloprotease [Gaiellales bacterium]
MRRLVPLALLLAALAAWLWQAQLPPDPPPVKASEVFTAAQISQARDYREPGYLLALAGLLVPLLLAAGLALRLPGPLARMRRGWLVAAAIAALLALAVVPLDWIAHVRARDAGLDLRGTAQWAADEAVGVGLQAVTVGAAYAAGLLLLRRLGKLGAALAVAALVAAFVCLQPLVVDPLLFSTRPIADPWLQAEVARLEQALDAHPASVTVTDAGSRTTAENAQVDGLGPTVRVTVDDTIIRAPRPQLSALLAHELTHVARLHTLKGTLWFVVLGVPLLLGIATLVERRRGSLASPPAVAAVLALCLLAFTVTLPLQNAISRRYEAEADWGGIRATGDGRGAEQLERRLAIANLSNPDPPRWVVWLLFDHPPVMERIAVARAYSSG